MAAHNWPDQIATFIERLPIDDGQLNCLCPAGIGDIAWFWSKFHAVAAKRKVVVWLPDSEHHRAGALCELFGVDYGYMPGLTTQMVWSYWDTYKDLPIPDSGGTIIVSANRNLEQGRRIERWYPELPFKTPTVDSNALSYKVEVGDARFVIAAMGAKTYMEGNLMPAQWARLLRDIERNIAPVLIQAGARSGDYAKEVLKYFDPTFSPAMNMPFSEKLTLMKNAVALIGPASGDTIMATYNGTPTLHAYPRWLKQMPGTWEHEEAVTDWCHVDELVLPGIVDRLAAIARPRDAK